MAKQTAEFTPLTIGGINVTPDLLQALNDLRAHGYEGMALFSESCLLISSEDIDRFGLEREFFALCHDFFQVLKALVAKEKGGNHEGV